MSRSWGIHTLRYYEHENLIIPLRNASNRRRYSEKDIAWIAFMKRLKTTGMTIKEIRKYAALRAEGDVTLLEGMKKLIQHRQSLNEQIRQLQEHEAMLDEKIAFYRKEISRVVGRIRPKFAAAFNTNTVFCNGLSTMWIQQT